MYTKEDVIKLIREFCLLYYNEYPDLKKVNFFLKQLEMGNKPR